MKQPIDLMKAARVERDASSIFRNGIVPWYMGLESVTMRSIVPNKKAAKNVAVFSADMINGFCRKGNLASPRIDAISAPVVDLFKRSYRRGIEKFVLLQEGHCEDAKEFESFPSHGILGTEEAETIPELLELPFANKFVIFRKNALTPAFARREEFFIQKIRRLGEGFQEYLRWYGHDIRTAIVVGNCTDLCVRELAMYLKMWANQHQRDLRVIIPESCVETFDMPLEVAHGMGLQPHPGDVYHLWALYEMARNGIDIVKKIV